MILRIAKITTLIMIVASINIVPCTTAIVSGKFTVDGRPLLVKHRDTSFEQNKLMFFKDGIYDYIGLVNSADKEGSEVWGGSNSAGFAIMNSASYNIKQKDDKTELKDREGIVMKLALQKCKTLEDFEKLLDTLNKPLGVEANFGVIDAYGGCAYYECNNFTYKKVDANDPSIAPFGYLIRTNYSFNGREDDGYGYIRYLTAEKLFYNAAARHDLSYRFILQDMSRCLEHSLTGVNLKEINVGENETKYVPFQDYIVRSSSVATVLVHGVKPGESPKLATVWTILGFQPASVAIPTWVDGGENLPSCLTADKSGNAPLCDNSLKIKAKCFPITRGSGKSYLNLPVIYNQDKTGIMQKIKPVEDNIIKMAESKMSNWRQLNHTPRQEVNDFYKLIDKNVDEFYKKELN